MLHSSSNPGLQPKVSENLDSHDTLYVSGSATSLTSMSEAPQETQIKLFKCFVESFNEPGVNSLASPEELLVSNFDELFQQLELEMANLNLLEIVCENLPVLTELQELMSKLSQPEAPSLISIVVLNLEILSDQAIQIIALKRHFIICFREKFTALAKQ